MKNYPISFYGRTWMMWAGALICGYFAVLGCFMGPLFWLGIIKPADGRPGYEAGIPLTIISVLLMPIAIAFAFQVYARQWPILKIYKEGLWIRSIGTPYQTDWALSATGIDMILIVFVMLWQLVTLRMFRTQVIHWRWEDLDIVLPRNGNFSIVGWLDNDDFTQNDMKPHTVSYGADSFEMSINKVRESVQFFHGNPDLRESLPSWQNDETEIGY